MTGQVVGGANTKIGGVAGDCRLAAHRVRNGGIEVADAIAVDIDTHLDLADELHQVSDGLLAAMTAVEETSRSARQRAGE